VHIYLLIKNNYISKEHQKDFFTPTLSSEGLANINKQKDKLPKFALPHLHGFIIPKIKIQQQYICLNIFIHFILLG
jgi:hypothetical protein